MPTDILAIDCHIVRRYWREWQFHRDASIRSQKLGNHVLAAAHRKDAAREFAAMLDYARERAREINLRGHLRDFNDY